MDVSSGAALAKGAISTVRELMEILKLRKFNDLELQRKIVELDGQVNELTRENERLRSKLESKAKTRFENPYYYEEESEVPLCPKCYDNSKGELRIRLTHPPEDFVGGRGRTCRTCKEFYREGPRTRPLRGGRPRPYSQRY